MKINKTGRGRKQNKRSYKPLNKKAEHINTSISTASLFANAFINIRKNKNRNYLPEKKIPSTHANATSLSANEFELHIIQNKKLFKPTTALLLTKKESMNT